MAASPVWTTLPMDYASCRVRICAQGPLSPLPQLTTTPLCHVCTPVSICVYIQNFRMNYAPVPKDRDLFISNNIVNVSLYHETLMKVCQVNYCSWCVPSGARMPRSLQRAMRAIRITGPATRAGLSPDLCSSMASVCI